MYPFHSFPEGDISHDYRVLSKPKSNLRRTQLNKMVDLTQISAVFVHVHFFFFGMNFCITLWHFITYINSYNYLHNQDHRILLKVC